mmetsp:Transcript_23069/g.51359  ORF Transcript_23069/g.51359 Transcript_23069/m.51359 type:complete len:150 (-) Transcript_23069:318-767(-)
MLRTKLLLSALLALIAAAALVPLVDSSRAEVEEEVRRRRRERAEQRPTTYGDTTREQILETRNRRKRQLTVMVMDARKKLADHSAGEKILAAEEKEQLENSVDLFQRKIESMEVELEEWEIERLIARETQNADRRRERSRHSRNIHNEL